MTRGIERTFSRPFSETFRISKNEDFNGSYLENKNEFVKNSFETVFRASKSCDRGQLVSAFQLTFNFPLNNQFFIWCLCQCTPPRCCFRPCSPYYSGFGMLSGTKCIHISTASLQELKEPGKYEYFFRVYHNNETHQGTVDLGLS